MKVGDLFIDESEIVESFVRASGPGGQNVNKVASAVELRFDARRSPSLPNDVAVRLIKLAGARATQDGVIVIFAQKFASQPRNREDARAASRGVAHESAGAAEAAPRDPPDARLESAPARRENPPRRGQGAEAPHDRGRLSDVIARGSRRRWEKRARRGRRLVARARRSPVDRHLRPPLLVLSPLGRRSRSVALPDRLACFAPLGGTSLLAGFAGGLEVFDLESGARRPIAAVEPDRPTTRVNDGKLDRRGRLVFGTMDEDPTAPGRSARFTLMTAERARAR